MENAQPKQQRRMDPVLIMDDIIEKLHLLNYQSKFCKNQGLKALSRTFFAFRDTSCSREFQVRYFFMLSYWLMSLADEPLNQRSNKKQTSKPASAKKQPVFEAFPTEEDAIERLFKDIKKFKVSLPDDFSYK